MTYRHARGGGDICHIDSGCLLPLPYVFSYIQLKYKTYYTAIDLRLSSEHNCLPSAV